MKTTTSQDDVTTGRQNPANVPSTSRGKTGSSHTSDLERRSFQIALEINNTQDKSDEESDSNKPAVVLHRNIDHIIQNPEVLATLLRNCIESRQEIVLQNGEVMIAGENWCRDVIIPNSLKITPRKKQKSKKEEKQKGNGKGKRSNKNKTKENAGDQEIEVTQDNAQELVQEIDDLIQTLDEPERQENVPTPTDSAPPDQGNQEPEVTGLPISPMEDTPTKNPDGHATPNQSEISEQEIEITPENIRSLISDTSSRTLRNALQKAKREVLHQNTH
jgi:hypothetical protein